MPTGPDRPAAAGREGGRGGPAGRVPQLVPALARPPAAAAGRRDRRGRDRRDRHRLRRRPGLAGQRGRTGVRLVSIEHDWLLADIARSVFAEVPAVTVLHGDWSELRAEAPFALLALDGGGQGKGAEAPLSPARVGAAGRHARHGRLHADPGVAADARRPARRRAAVLAGAPGPAGHEVRTEPDAASVVATAEGRRALRRGLGRYHAAHHGLAGRRLGRGLRWHRKLRFPAAAAPRRSGSAPLAARTPPQTSTAPATWSSVGRWPSTAAATTSAAAAGAGAAARTPQRAAAAATR